LGKMESAANVCPGDAERGRSMATNKMASKISRGETPSPKKVRPKKAMPEVATPEEAVSNRPTAAPEAKPATKAKRLPAATIKALKELEAGELTRYADADDLFQKLDIKLGKD
jgi:hypothetical protein